MLIAHSWLVHVNKFITLSVSLHLPYMVKHKVLLDKRCSVVRRSFSLWDTGQTNAEYSPSVLNIKEEVVKGLEVAFIKRLIKLRTCFWYIAAAAATDLSKSQCVN